MTDISDFFAGRFMKCENLKGKAKIVKIESAQVETIKDDKGRGEEKITVAFDNDEQDLILNKTNANSIKEIAGHGVIEDWAGVEIELYPTTTPFGREVVDCIRIRKPTDTPF